MWLSLAAFAVAGALVGWDYWARLEAERRLKPYFESEATLETNMRKWPSRPKGTGPRAQRVRSAAAEKD